MELRSTGNPDVTNPVTMSMLEYLRKKGIEAMSGICKYPESVCPHMTVLRGRSYCDVTPCQLTGELPKQSNAQRIRNMDDEELVRFLMDFDTCTYCDNSSADECTYETCQEIGEPCLLEWLKQPVED